jgi:hypothetical protein
LNGPRFWTLDHTARATGEVLSFGGLTARRVAELPIPPGLDLAGGPGGRHYRDIMIRRETEWIFAAGRPAYELLTPDRDLTLRTAGGAAHVLQDELQNTYMQLMTARPRIEGDSVARQGSSSAETR